MKKNFTQSVVALLILCSIIYVLQMASQIASTPFGEGMDSYGHWSFLEFYHQFDRRPLPDEESKPSYLVNLQGFLPGPDHSDGSRYQAWTEQDPIVRKEKLKEILSEREDPEFIAPNYQTQHPFLYYWLTSRVLKLIRGLDFDLNNYLLSLFSVFLTALGFPIIYLIFRQRFSRYEALMLLLIMAWYPNLMVFFGRVCNDSLAFLLMTPAVLACTARTPRTAATLLCGICLGLAFYIKTYALAIAPACIACISLTFSNEPGKRIKLHLRYGIILAACLIPALMWLFYQNLQQTGHLILMLSVSAVETFTLKEKIIALLTVPQIWFWGGLFKGFFWSGYWSFVSPGWTYYLPLFIVPITLFTACKKFPATFKLIVTESPLWKHLLIIGMFLLAMWYHAAMSYLRYQLPGETVRNGNEGWYFNVLLPSVMLLLFSMIKISMSASAFKRLLHYGVVATILWNIIARFSLISFWGGATGLHGRLRGIHWMDSISGWIQGDVLSNWLSQPGVLSPVIWSVLCPLILAAVCTGFILHREHPFDPSSGTSGD